jgi:hypothetical protein
MHTEVAFTIAEACAAVGIGKTAIYDFATGNKVAVISPGQSFVRSASRAPWRNGKPADTGHMAVRVDLCASPVSRAHLIALWEAASRPPNRS